jgi:multisubunit Na+/H+ antiporter MnhE subunit
MINIFNLFLTLLSFWLLFAYSNGNLSWFYVFFGIIASLIVSLISWKIKIITKHSNFLFLHIGFYKHFLGIIFSSFAASLLIIFKVAIGSSKIDYKIYSLPIKRLNNSELVLLIPTINLLPGVIFIRQEDQKIIIFALSKHYINKLDLAKICSELTHINDNRLV